MSVSPDRHSARRRRRLGAAILVAGLAGMWGVLAAAYGDSEASVAWSLRLGLGGLLFASACAQLLVVLGGWLIWRSRRSAD